MRATDCQHCGAELTGRVDKLYCNEACSKAYRKARADEEQGRYWVRGHYRQRRARKPGQGRTRAA